jgi:hypothetical protein
VASPEWDLGQLSAFFSFRIAVDARGPEVYTHRFLFLPQIDSRYPAGGCGAQAAPFREDAHGQ